MFSDWFKASQWLYAAGVALMGMALFMLFIVACCSEKVYAKAMTAAGALMLIAGELHTCHCRTHFIINKLQLYLVLVCDCGVKCNNFS